MMVRLFWLAAAVSLAFVSCGTETSVGGEGVQLPAVRGASSGFGRIALTVQRSPLTAAQDLLIVEVVDGVPMFDEAVQVDIPSVNFGSAAWISADELIYVSQAEFAGDLTIRRISADGVVKSTAVADIDLHLEGFIAANGRDAVLSLSRDPMFVSASNIYSFSSDTGETEYMFGSSSRAQKNPVSVPGGWLYTDIGLPGARPGPDLVLRWTDLAGNLVEAIDSPGDVTRLAVNADTSVIAATGFATGDRQSPMVWVANIEQVGDQGIKISEWRPVFEGRAPEMVFVGDELWVFDDDNSLGGSTPTRLDYR